MSLVSLVFNHKTKVLEELTQDEVITLHPGRLTDVGV